MTAPAPAAAVRYVEVFGVHVDPADITAVYAVLPDCWTDMPEARPRARCTAKAGAEPDQMVYVMADGSLRYDKAGVRIDTYQGEKYAEVRAEGERRWAAIDKARASGQ